MCVCVCGIKVNVLICIFLRVSTVPVLVLQASVWQFGLSFIFVFFPPGCPAAANVTGRIRERSFFVNLNISAGATDTRDPMKSRIGTLVPTSRAVFRRPTRAFCQVSVCHTFSAWVCSWQRSRGKCRTGNRDATKTARAEPAREQIQATLPTCTRMEAASAAGAGARQVEDCFPATIHSEGHLWRSGQWGRGWRATFSHQLQTSPAAFG